METISVETYVPYTSRILKQTPLSTEELDPIKIMAIYVSSGFIFLLCIVIIAISICLCATTKFKKRQTKGTTFILY